VSQEPVIVRTAVKGRCDCPCHDGENVFHVVSCCGSVLTFPLWKPEARIAPGAFEPPHTDPRT
jgi:hypothetical protein